MRFVKGHNLGLIRQSALLVLNSGVVNALGVFSGLFLANALGAEGRGIVAILMVPAQFVAGLASFSIGAVIVFHLSRAPRQIKTRLKYELIRVGCLFSVIGIIAFLVWVRVIELQGFSLVAFAMTLMFIIAEIAKRGIVGAAIGQKQFRVVRFLNLLRPSLYLLGLLIGFSLGVLTPAWAVGAMTLATVSLLYARRKDIRWGKLPNRQVRRQLLKTTRNFYPAQLLQLLRNNVDKIIVASVLSPKEVGVYIVAYTLAWAPFSIFIQAASTVLFPQFSDKSYKQQQQLMGISVLIAIIVGPLLVALYWSVYPEIVPRLIGAGFSDVARQSTLMGFAFTGMLISQIFFIRFRSERRGLSASLIELVYVIMLVSSMMFLTDSNALGADTIISSMIVASWFSVLTAGIVYAFGKILLVPQKS